ncbi:hypothetical protein Ocin01_06084 [Orchesella cincta]|uniref:Uncharacterized protein n=1 Tax=Orchesella cincta TaxID=48709 RepID=A0A1D2N6A2_ORCCI|nr:hypothetical protein Ocin01_06084 [Orchesella cincta]
MASPIKTEETMDLAQALREDDSSTDFHSYENLRAESTDSEYLNKRIRDLDPTFRNLVVTKESSTELIPTQFVESSDVTDCSTPVVRDLNAGKGVVGDDGKPIVGRVFSRVYQMSGESKMKSSKSRRHRKTEESPVGKQNSPPRPQSSQDGKSKHLRESNNNTRSNNSSSLCPACGRHVSEETMKQHRVFCKNAAKKVK